MKIKDAFAIMTMTDRGGVGETERETHTALKIRLVLLRTCENSVLLML